MYGYTCSNWLDEEEDDEAATRPATKVLSSSS